MLFHAWVHNPTEVDPVQAEWSTSPTLWIGGAFCLCTRRVSPAAEDGRAVRHRRRTRIPALTCQVDPLRLTDRDLFSIPIESFSQNARLHAERAGALHNVYPTPGSYAFRAW